LRRPASVAHSLVSGGTTSVGNSIRLADRNHITVVTMNTADWKAELAKVVNRYKEAHAPRASPNR
jgi:hypothetical protein